MNKYRVYITQQVQEILTVEVEASNKEEARELAEQKRVEAESGDWDSCVKDVDYDIDEIDEETE